jgi:peptidoglycan/xylan/chitin deacetylase (PgdA/CDA1 family)
MHGEKVAEFVADDGSVVAAWADPATETAWIPFDLEEAYLNYVHERWRGMTPQVALSEHQLELYYRVKRFIPRSVQLTARRALIRRQRNPTFPHWPLDESIAHLTRFYAKCLLLARGATELPFRWFWPDGHTAAVTLTHDVESAEGLRLAIEVADIEQERGFRSSFNIVADWYRIDWGILRELRERGFELGVHGVHHDRSMFASRTQFEQQLPVVHAMARELGASGFRSPATHRVVEWLAELPVEYDCSVPHADPFEPQPGGCCSLWPFFIGDVVELPHTLPQDHTLFTLLGHRTIDLWRDQVARIEELNGLIQVLTHPDPGYLAERRNRDLYTELVDVLAARTGLWRAAPRDVARWWRTRADTDTAAPFGLARVEGADVVFEPPGR